MKNFTTILFFAMIAAFVLLCASFILKSSYLGYFAGAILLTVLTIKIVICGMNLFNQTLKN